MSIGRPRCLLLFTPAFKYTILWAIPFFVLPWCLIKGLEYVLQLTVSALCLVRYVSEYTCVLKCYDFLREGVRLFQLSFLLMGMSLIILSSTVWHDIFCLSEECNWAGDQQKVQDGICSHRRLIRNFNGYSMGSRGSNISSYRTQRIWSDCGTAHTDLNICCTQMPTDKADRFLYKSYPRL